MLVVPAALNAFEGAGGRSGFFGLVTFTPLHVFWAGTEAVFIFFVLSGFVLTRATESTRFSWRSYYPSRLLRLYLPVAGALAFAAVLIASVPQTAPAGSSWWLGYQEKQLWVGGRYLIHSLLLVRGSGLLPPLWSLKWEVIFSLVLPVAAFGASRRWFVGLAQGVVLLAVMLLGSDSSAPKDHIRNYLLYLPMFGIGAVMARNHQLLSKLGRGLSTLTGTLALSAGLILLTLSWTVRDESSTAYRSIAVLGAALIVFLFGYWQPLREAAETRPLQWLGTRSFSLYLIHYPIVISSAILLGSRSRFTFAIAIPLSLVAADVFFRLVEGPSHKLSQRLKTRIGSRGTQPQRVPVAAARRI
jgi:peptidoglycan/LPS O-acetylase OafA/YrhL